MDRAYKFRIYPNKEQEKQIQSIFGATRFVYNYYLDKRIKAYETEKKTLSAYECSKDLTKLREELPWLKEINRSSLTYTLRNLDSAYKNFFRRVKQGEAPGFPKFKSKIDRNKSYTTQCMGNSIKVFKNAVQIPKVGKVKCRVSQQVDGRILSATISQVSSGQYFVSLCCTDVDIEKLPDTGKSASIDVGIKTLATVKAGTDYIKYENHKYLAQSQKRLAKLQRDMDRKQKGSNNWNKARIKVAKLQEKIANQRKDTLHKTSSDIIKNYDTICIEDLDVRSMIEKGNRNLSRNAADTSLGEFNRQLEYKANWYGRNILKVDRYYASSQICSICGYKNEAVKDLSVRTWTCPQCGTVHDRDENAANNIMNEAMKNAA